MAKNYYCKELLPETTFNNFYLRLLLQLAYFVNETGAGSLQEGIPFILYCSYDYKFIQR